MLTITGLVAVVLVFLSGPYHTLQMRWPRIWGSPLSTWAHSNVSLAAAVVVFIHIAPRFSTRTVSGELRLCPLRQCTRYRAHRVSGVAARGCGLLLHDPV